MRINQNINLSFMRGIGLMKSNSCFSTSLKFIISALIIITIAAGCKMQEVVGCWASGPIKIDGQRSEWTKIPATYFEDQDVAIGLCNDNDYLYLFFSFNNQTWARAIQSTGLTLWLDGEAKKNKDLGICYKGGPTPDKMGMGDRPNMPEGREQNEDMPDDFAEKMKERQEEQEQLSKIITVINNKIDREDIIPSEGPDGPAVAFNLSKDIYTYEFRLPLAGGGLGQYGFGANQGEFVSIGAEWGEMEMGDGNRPEGMGGGRSGGGPGGGGGMPGGCGGGRGGGGPGGGEPGGGMQQSEKQEFWIKTQLVVPPGLQEQEAITTENGK